jgi:hypothetical protein
VYDYDDNTYSMSLVSDEGRALYDEYLAEQRESNEEDAGDGYDLNDPKHPTFYERMVG